MIKILAPKDRLYNIERPIIGVTGGVATGKSTLSKILIDKNHPLICADELVKNIYAEESSKYFLKSINSDFIKNNEVDFKYLRKTFFTNIRIKKEIEEFIYSNLEYHFIEATKKFTENYLIYDVPLLFEKNLDQKLDFSVLIHCRKENQIDRLIKRDNITKDLALKMISSQMPLTEKVKKANLLIANDDEIKALKSQYKNLLEPLIKSL